MVSGQFFGSSCPWGSYPGTISPGGNYPDTVLLLFVGFNLCQGPFLKSCRYSSNPSTSIEIKYLYTHTDFF